MRIRRAGSAWGRLQRGLSIKQHHKPLEITKPEPPMTYQGNRKIEIRQTTICGVGPWVWFETESGAWDGPQRMFPKLREACLEALGDRPRRTVLSAGGCLGMYPRLWAEDFEHVVTVEPCPDNFAVLKENCQGDKFRSINAGLTDVTGKGWLHRQSMENVGMHTLKEDRREDGIAVDVITIDDLDLTELDLLQLDVEGWEAKVLNGAAKTIHSLLPVISVETVNDDVKRFMKDQRYEVYKFISPDTVYVPI